jgi:hypothetical protein
MKVMLTVINFLMKVITMIHFLMKVINSDSFPDEGY